MPDPHYPNKQYTKDFLTEEDLNKAALERAHDLRKFEIDLYWKRATYFWTLIAATLAGFVLVQTSSDPSIKANMSVLLACLGIVFSFGWFCVNRGSKFWQENWEFHVDMLENAIDGPLYKVVISRGRSMGEKWLSRLLFGKISVSKVNQLISVIVTLMWVYLLWYSLLPFTSIAPVDCKYLALVYVVIVAAAGGLFLLLVTRSTGDHSRIATLRSRPLKNDTSLGDT